MMFSDVAELLGEIEKIPNLDSRIAIKKLRTVCLDEFAEILINLPNADYPKLSKLLPSMATKEVQETWTGASGYPLLRESVTFVRAIWHAYERLTGKDISESKVLDYGCGYGRLIRPMLRLVDEDALYGCDPWETSIDLCKEARLPCHLDVTEYLPKNLPYPRSFFDLIYAFSVFTHTSKRATLAALSALRNVISKDGLLALTVRPIDYWDFHKGLSDSQRSKLKQAYKNDGYSFLPHNRVPIDGDITYGDTAIPYEFFERELSGWKLVANERTVDAPYQRILYLRPD